MEAKKLKEKMDSGEDSSFQLRDIILANEEIFNMLSNDRQKKELNEVLEV